MTNDERYNTAEERSRRSKSGAGVRDIIIVLAVLAAFFCAIAYGESTFRARMLAECPSGAAVRVCDRVDGEMRRERFGRACTALTSVLRACACNHSTSQQIPHATGARQRFIFERGRFAENVRVSVDAR